VHLFGNSADLHALSELAERHGLAIVEDAAEAHGATFDGRPVGAIGDIGTFSFYGNKIITTGEGGMVVTNDEGLARRALLLRGQGQSFERTYWFEVVGFNYRMTNVAAAIGVAQLEDVATKLRRRAWIAARYRAGLEDVPGLAFQAEAPPGSSVHWLVSVLLPVESAAERDAVGVALREDGIETRPFFYPLHSLPPYAAGAPDLPVAERLAARGLCLPTYGGLSDDDVDFVCERLRANLAPPSPPSALGGANSVVGDLREVGAGDAEALAQLFGELGALPELIRHFHPHVWDVETARAIAGRSGRDVYLGWFEDGRIVGYAMLRGWDEGFERPSFGVVVLPDRAGRGIGSRLRGRCLELARERGARTMMLKVHRDNERALSWYRDVGFEIVGEADDGQWLCELELVSAPARS
jgi:ribosomal protein S18 acetylase RimI-like enzyme